MEHVLWISIYWEFHHPNWRTPSFFRGVGIPPTRIYSGWSDVFSYTDAWLECAALCGKPDVRASSPGIWVWTWMMLPCSRSPQMVSRFQGLGPKELENAQDAEVLALGCPKGCWYLLYSSFFFLSCSPLLWNDPHWVSFLGCSGPLAPRALTTWNIKLSDYLLSWSSNIRAVRFQLGNLSIECIEFRKTWNTWKIAGWAWLCPSWWSLRLRKRLCQSIGSGPKCCCPSHFFHFAAFHFAGVKFYNSLHPSWTTVSITQQCSASPTVLGGV